MAEDQEFFVGQKAFIKKDGKLLILFDTTYSFDFPGGKIQEGENDFEEALKREVKEETGLEIKVGKPFVTWQFTFSKNPNHRNYGKKVFLVGYNAELISGEVTLSPEHNNFKWIGENEWQELDDGTGYFKALKAYFTQ